jgi:CheY-like chemotaxis protein
MARILIVDDEVTFRSVVATALTQNGHSIVEAEDGRTALAALKAQAFDLVITDVIMPEQDGLEVIMNVRDANNPIPIIAMTGHPAKADLYLRLAKALGAQRVLEKPFRIEDLLGAVRDLLETPPRK